MPTERTSSFKPVLALECTKAEIEFIAQTFVEVSTQMALCSEGSRRTVLYAGQMISIKALLVAKAREQHRMVLFAEELYGLNLSTDVMNQVLRISLSYNVTKGAQVVQRHLTFLLGKPAPLEASMVKELGI